jgi:hypothetical protein
MFLHIYLLFILYKVDIVIFTSKYTKYQNNIILMLVN